MIRFLYQIAITMHWDLEMMLKSFNFLLAELPAPPGVVRRNTVQFLPVIITGHRSPPCPCAVCCLAR